MAQTNLSPEERKVADKVVILSKELIILLAVFTVSLFSFVIIAYRVFYLDKTGADERAFAFAHSLVTDGMTQLMEFVTFFGSHYFLIPANLILCAFFLLKKKSRYSIKISAIALSSLLIMLGLKLLFNRHRPLIPLLEPARGLSFPSGHAFMSMCFYGLLMIIIWKEERPHPMLKWFLLVLVIVLLLFIGFSRIYLRVHYFTDVLAGFSIGFFWLFMSSFLIDKIKPVGLKKS
ncbi:phosphatase PAP2 family protein [Niastella caeni]|uniref:Phosphatase PAP2 family protein n=1 Tax=Niastella caeni TaxID=2569763 RepID=A0A4S8I419_9BACT|nr:phosphatase PAP2 family protein [Niastella caeni]THU41994.1 phosphatase PAP2 family protein [Niastella caeni]